MVGIYSYTVILTYISGAIAFLGMVFSFMGMHDYAMLCLALSGACDTFDGKIARSKKNRTEEEIIFGTQIDSLCDIVCFGVAPAVMAYNLGVNKWSGVLVEIIFIICGIIRLAYFNVVEELKHRGMSKEKRAGYYHGLPITSIAMILPIIYMFRPYMNSQMFLTVVTFSMLAIAFLYILDFPIKKPSNPMVALMITFMVFVILKILHVFELFV